MLKQGIFREYDIRGIADVELQDSGVEVLGRALGTYLIRHSGHTIALGRDCRLSGERLHDALLKGLMAAGCRVLDVGMVPTPVLYFSAVHFKANGAIMITGSHNPSEYNGFKTVVGTGSLHGQGIQDVYKLITDKDFDSGEGNVTEVDAVTPYIEEVAGQFRFDRKVKVVIDAGNGTAGPAMHRILEKLNVEAVEMFFEMDGRFPNHHPDPTVLSNLDQLVKAVRKEKAELGIA